MSLPFARACRNPANKTVESAELIAPRHGSRKLIFTTPPRSLTSSGDAIRRGIRPRRRRRGNSEKEYVLGEIARFTVTARPPADQRRGLARLPQKMPELRDYLRARARAI